jgi:hypothetical protein
VTCNDFSKSTEEAKVALLKIDAADDCLRTKEVAAVGLVKSGVAKAVTDRPRKVATHATSHVIFNIQVAVVAAVIVLFNKRGEIEYQKKEHT